MSSGISSLKPAKTHTAAFPGAPLSQLDRTPSAVQTVDRQAGEDSQADGFPPVSGGAPGPHRNQLSQPLGSAAPSFSGQQLCPDGLRKVTNCTRLTSRPSRCWSLTSPSSTPSGRRRAPLPLLPARGPALGPDWSPHQS